MFAHHDLQVPNNAVFVLVQVQSYRKILSDTCFFGSVNANVADLPTQTRHPDQIYIYILYIYIIYICIYIYVYIYIEREREWENMKFIVFFVGPWPKTSD